MQIMAHSPSKHTQPSAGVASGGDAAAELARPDAEEERCRSAIEGEKAAYSAAFERLRALKGEIQHLQVCAVVKNDIPAFE